MATNNSNDNGKNDNNNSEMIAERDRLDTEIIGKTLEEANDMCTHCCIRATIIDKKLLMVTKDLRLNRINVSIDDGLITGITGHG